MTTEQPALPTRMRTLPRDSAGRPVPWFVAWVDDKPDFRVIADGKIERALRYRLCWVCGHPITGATCAYVIGPMCAVNRISAEPPSHRDCAVYSAQACPFLSNPTKGRRLANMPDGVVEAPGIAIKRNPGVALVWITRGKTRVIPEGRGVLFDIGLPVRCLWFAEGREATREEVMASIASGLPALQELAAEEGVEAVQALQICVERALTLVPA